MVEADLDVPARLFRSFDDRARLGDAPPHGFLEQHVLSGVKGGNGNLCQKAIRRGHADDVNVRRVHQRLPVTFDARTAAGRDLRGSARFDIRYSNAPAIVVEVRCLGAPPPDQTASDHADAELRHTQAFRAPPRKSPVIDWEEGSPTRTNCDASGFLEGGSAMVGC